MGGGGGGELTEVTVLIPFVPSNILSVGMIEMVMRIFPT